MHRPMDGVRVVEVAQFTFVPAAGAILADWGAQVIHIEHPERGDAGRGLNNMGDIDLAAGSFRPIFEHPNRGKRSLGVDLAHPSGLAVLSQLVQESDVFLTNFLPDARRRLKIDVEDIRAINPKIIYARGSGFGVRGPDCEKGGFDGTAFWARAGSSSGVTPPELDEPLFMPAGGYGDSMSGMTLAGGISAALFSRERTGEPSVVDASLLSVGAWVMGLSVDLSLLSGAPVPSMAWPKPGPARNPIHGSFQTADGRWLQFSMIQAGRYWGSLCEHIGRPDLATDDRFSTVERLMANADVAHQIVKSEIASRTFNEWIERFDTFDGAWAPIQNSLEVAHDPQLRANGYIAPVVDVEGNTRELLANPVQFDESPATLTRAPQFAEHTDEILRELGYGDDELMQLKLDGAVT
jgi:crotonobetainyl-CoA:carnitine CoA-transferase CaiB-like acyl-CoA transferase